MAFWADTSAGGCTMDCVISTLLDAFARKGKLMILRRPSLLLLLLFVLLPLLLLRLHDFSFLRKKVGERTVKQ